jgi:hypothetical protein
MLILTSAFSASFDCSKATTNVEKLICSDEELSQLDDELNKAYKELLSKVNDNDKKMIIQEQRKWLKERAFCKDDVYCLRLFCLEKTNKFLSQLRTLVDRKSITNKILKLQKIEHYPTYAEVLEDKNISFSKSSDRNLYSNVRPANNFQLIGGTKNPICKETIALFNEEGTYKIDTNWTSARIPESRPEDSDYLFWYLDNSGLVLWETLGENINNNVIPSNRTSSKNLQYIEIDIDKDGKNEYAYRLSGITRSIGWQKIRIFNEKLQDNIASLEKYKVQCKKIYGQNKCNDNISIAREVVNDGGYQKEWQSTENMHKAINRIVYDQKSLDILYLDNSIALSRYIGLGIEFGIENYLNLYKTKYGIILVSTPYIYIGSNFTPEFLVFSLHRNKLATLECIMMPKEWQ